VPNIIPKSDPLDSQSESPLPVKREYAVRELHTSGQDVTDEVQY